VEHSEQRVVGGGVIVDKDKQQFLLLEGEQRGRCLCA
jgi:hypothetical protein